jgi:uncharacterized protein involved in exopolysaccharide biosynthesis
MNLIYFFRLLYKNIFLILGIALFMAILVYFSTRNQPKTYSTSSTVYTGIATGYDIESGVNARFDMFATNAKFDNLINIIKSRETQEKTAIRLMAQHLILSKPDPRYCLPETWRKLMSDLPAEIKRMVDESRSARTEPSAAAVPGPAASNTDGIVNPGDFIRYENLVKAMTDFKDANQENYLFKTLQSSNPYYSVQKISSIRVTRIQSSDLLRLSFDSNDPAVCMQTLKILTQVFTEQYQAITATQTGLVSEYYRRRVIAAKYQLDNIEWDLLHFRMENQLIKYEEQTKFISGRKQTLERDWYEEAGKYSAAKTALALIEENLGKKDRTILENSAVHDKRKLVYEQSLKISMEEVKEQIDTKSLSRLKTELEQLKLDLNNEILKSFQVNRTVQGLSVQSVLQKWLEKAIEVEETQARYNTQTERKNAFLKKYDEFAPLGSQLKIIDREIDLAQQDYLNHLNNLNQSIMKQKNVEQSEIQIIDNPIYPLKPNASKRMVTLIAAFMAGLVLTAALIILLEFIDSSIKLPDRLAELSGLKLIGAFPRMPAKPDDRINYPVIASRALDQITQRIRLEDLGQKNRVEPTFILFFISTREKEGKTYLATRVVEKLRSGGSKVLFVKPLDKSSQADIKRQFTSFDLPVQAWNFEYSVPENFISIKNINELLRNYSFLTKGYHYLVIELPALLVQEFPATMTQSGHLTVMVARATRTWNKADNEVLSLYRSSTSHTVLALLNGCQVDHLESIIGEIPKRRSFLRKWIKKIINLDFKTKSEI